MPYIYKITSPTGKVYVGSTINVQQRWKKYYNLHCKSQIKLYNSFLKYGTENHLFEIICECNNSEKYKLENYYGNLYNVLNFKNGLNLSLPKVDDIVSCISDETRIKMSNSNKEFKNKNPQRFFEMQQKAKEAKQTKEYKEKNSNNVKNWILQNPQKHIELQKKSKATRNKPEVKEKLSKIRKQWFIDNPNKAKNLKDKVSKIMKTDENRNKNSEAQKKLYKNGYRHPRAKYVLDTQTGIYYNSAREAGRLLGIKSILLILSGHKKNNTSLIYA